eukprot:459549_1
MSISTIICMILIVPQYHSQTKRLLSASDDTSETDENTIEDLKSEVNVLKASIDLQILSFTAPDLSISNGNTVDVSDVCNFCTSEETDIETKVNGLQNTIEDLKSEVNVVKASIDSYVTAANDNETKINGLQNTIEDLKSEMNVLKASIETQVNADGDKDSTNEIQDLSIDGSTLKISKGGTSVTLKIENIVGLGAKLCSGCDTPMCTS